MIGVKGAVQSCGDGLEYYERTDFHAYFIATYIPEPGRLPWGALACATLAFAAQLRAARRPRVGSPASD